MQINALPLSRTISYATIDVRGFSMDHRDRHIPRHEFVRSTLFAVTLVLGLVPPFGFSQSRTTPLGTQSPFPDANPPKEQPPLEPPGQTIARVVAAYGPQWVSGQVRDSVAEGKLTYFTVDG